MAEKNSRKNDSSNPAAPAAARHLVYFDDRTALHLSQAFSQEVELSALLQMLFVQLQAVTDTRGLQYQYGALDLDFNFGERDRHSADYNLSFRDAELGSITLFFPCRQHEQHIQTCEDLISLAFISLRNAVMMLQARNQPASTELSPAEARSFAATFSSSEPHNDKTDALILVALDDYGNIKSRDGEEWAQILMSSVHDQIIGGLRGADGVYHIGDDLIAVLLPNTNLLQAETVGKKIRLLVASLHLRGNNLSNQLTACMGISSASTAVSAEEVMDHAKLALREAQTEGNNQISLYRPVEPTAVADAQNF